MGQLARSGARKDRDVPRQWPARCSVRRSLSDWLPRCVRSVCGTERQIAAPQQLRLAAEPSPPSAVCREASLGHGGITVKVVAPGFFATESNAKEIADPSVVSWINHRTALGRWGDPREIAGVVAFLASDAASYITRQVLFGYPHRQGAAGA
jgi:hypothetical protein